jgi:hypothetical protein
MADLEERAIKRDGRFLLRLILLLCMGLVASAFVFLTVTGERTSGCIADALLSAPQSSHPAARPER